MSGCAPSCCGANCNTGGTRGSRWANRGTLSAGIVSEEKLKRSSMMRKVTAGLFISLDGVTEAPHEWQFDVFDEDMMTAMTDHINAVDTILLGRVTYQDWASYW